jgi:hypothetical protein
MSNDAEAPSLTTDDILDPLQLLDYGRFISILGRIPEGTPARFEVISEIYERNYPDLTRQQVVPFAQVLQNVYDKLGSVYGPSGELDRERHDVNDPVDYGLHSVVAITSVKACLCCGAELKVLPKGTVAFFYRQSGEIVRGTTYNKSCQSVACSSKMVYCYSFVKDDSGENRVYPPEASSFNGYDRSEWYQVSKETFFETLLLKETEFSLFFSHVGFYPKSRIYNATHELVRTSIPQTRQQRLSGAAGARSDTSTPPGCTPTPDTNPPSKRQKHTHRYSLDRKALKRAVFSRRVALFVHTIAPWMRSEIALGDEKKLELALMQVSTQVYVHFR